MITNEHIEQYLAQAHRYGDAKLMLCSSGNLSWRIGEEALVSNRFLGAEFAERESIHL